MTQQAKQLPDLSGFTGTEHYYKHGLTPFVYTDGVAHLAESVGAHWLIDVVLTNQLVKKVRAQAFQVWKLVVGKDHKAVAVCEDGNDHKVFQQKIPYTDFPESGITLFFSGGVLLLPSEY